MSKEVDNIIDELDPDKKKCTLCKKYRNVSEFGTTKMTSGDPSSTCDPCWDRMMNPRTYRKKHYGGQKNQDNR